MLTWTKVSKTFCACWLYKVGYKSLSSCCNKLLRLWSHTVRSEQDICLPDWEGRSHIAGGFIVSIVGGQDSFLLLYLYFSHVKHGNVKTHNLDVGFQKSLQFMNFLCMTLNFGVLCSIVQKIWRVVFF